MAISTRAARRTTRARCTCTSRPIETLRAVNGTLPVNVKFLIEGEEEVGGEAIAKYVAQNPEKLKADVALVSDTSLYAEGTPTLCIGLRGLIYTEVEATGPMRDLHSGLYGGAAPNAVFGLIELLAKAKSAAGVIRIPGIYDDVEPPAAAEKESWERLPFREKDFLKKRSRLEQADRREQILCAGADLGAADTRGARYRGRVHRRRRENRDPGEGDRQGQLPAGSETGSRESDRILPEVCREEYAERHSH